eukprot:11185199-Ditylum_brightwellii.AAC.1
MDTVSEERMREGRQCYKRDNTESKARWYNGTVLSGKLQAAVCTTTGRGRGGVLFPMDNCTKAGKP